MLQLAKKFDQIDKKENVVRIVLTFGYVALSL